jgi:hypothetical protein
MPGRWPRCAALPSARPLTPLPLPALPRARQDAKKPRAQPGDFERQVDQIRKDIDSVRSNLEDAEKCVSRRALLFISPCTVPRRREPLRDGPFYR